MGRRTMAAVTGVTALGLATGFVVVQSNGEDEADDMQEVASTTARVEQRTLTETETLEGILDFGEAYSVVAAGNGTLTTVALDESVVNRGGELFSVNLRPTILLYGDIPFYRELQEGVDGPDVTQLQENLLELDFTDDGSLEATGEFDASTRRAVEAWQESLDLEPTGVVAMGDAVFLPGPVRIAGTQVPLGSPVQPGAQVLDYTSTSQEVSVELEVNQGDLAAVDDTVEVVLPDGTRVDGTVTAAAHRPATGDSGDTGGGSAPTDDDEADPTVEVTIVLDDTDAAEEYISANVDVVFTRSETEDVLTVPVTALLAAEGGGYALEVVSESGDTTDDSQPATTLVRVELGTNADGFVEVQGDIAEGDEVVVAA